MEHPLHPETQALVRQCRNPRPRIEEVWRVHVGRHGKVPPTVVWGEVPLIASHRLMGRIRERVAGMLGGLIPWLNPVPDDRWPCNVRADVLALDLAIAYSDEEPGWDLRWVELQAFTSVLAALVVLRRAHQACWPSLEGRGPHALGLRAAIGRHVAPHAEHAVLLEHDPARQITRFDLEASSALWGLPLVEPSSLRRVGNGLQAQIDRRWRPVHHVLNRLIPRHTPHPQEAHRLLSGVDATWHSHPRWYERIDKGVLVDLKLAPEEVCTSADRWRELGRPSSDLVAKARHSCGGRDVLLSVSADQLDRLTDPTNWLVQPRFRPFPLANARDGAPLFGEIRCMVALPSVGAPWLMGCIVRLSRGDKSSMSNKTGAPGEGVGLLYEPLD